MPCKKYMLVYPHWSYSSSVRLRWQSALPWRSRHSPGFSSYGGFSCVSFHLFMQTCYAWHRLHDVPLAVSQVCMRNHIPMFKLMFYLTNPPPLPFHTNSYLYLYVEIIHTHIIVYTSISMNQYYKLKQKHKAIELTYMVLMKTYNLLIFSLVQ